MGAHFKGNCMRNSNLPFFMYNGILLNYILKNLLKWSKMSILGSGINFWAKMLVFEI